MREAFCRRLALRKAGFWTLDYHAMALGGSQ